jgi:hypothetical protein
MTTVLLVLRYHKQRWTLPFIALYGVVFIFIAANFFGANVVKFVEVQQCLNTHAHPHARVVGWLGGNFDWSHADVVDDHLAHGCACDAMCLAHNACLDAWVLTRVLRPPVASQRAAREGQSGVQ